MKTFFIASVISLLAFVTPHPHHITIMQIDHEPKSKSVQITLKGFVNDLELGLKDMHGHPIHFDQATPDGEFASKVSDYLKQHVSFTVNSKAMEYSILGWEVEKDETFFYMEISGVKTIESIAVRNELLMKQFSDQTNIVHLKANDSNRSLYLTADRREKEFSFN